MSARTFPTAQEDAEKEIVSPNARYEGPESAYRLAFTDVDFLLREELRPIRLQLELLKPQLVQEEQGVEATIVLFGSARVVAPDVAERELAAARAEDDPRALKAAETRVAMSRYYEEARRFAGNRDAPVGIARQADLRRHRRRPGDHGSRQPGRVRGRRQERRPQHRPLARAGAEPLHHSRAVLPVPLLRAAQDALPDARDRPGLLPGRLRHARRAVRGADAGADRQVAGCGRSCSSGASSGPG